MGLERVINLLTGRRVKPAPSADGSELVSRSSLYGEALTLPLTAGKNHMLADEGSYFVATNPTPGTAIAGIAAANGLDDTEALLFLRNASSSTKRVYLDYIMLRTVAVGTNGTTMAIAMKTDSGTSRFASGGSAITPVNPNQASDTGTAIDLLRFGAVVPTAASTEVRLVHHAKLRNAIKVAGDTFVFAFGGQPTSMLANQSGETTTPLYQLITCPPVILGAGDTFLLHEFAASQSVAATYEFALGWWER